MESAFTNIRKQMADQTTLAYLDDNRQYLAGMDASGYGLGVWIGQKRDDGNLRFTAFASRSLSKPEKNYGATKRELLTVV